MARYQEINDDLIYDHQEHVSIPTDPNNTDYQEYLRWVEAGNTPDPPPDNLLYQQDGRLQGQVTTTNAVATDLLRVSLAPLTGYMAHLRVIGIDQGNGAMYALQGYVTVKRLSGVPLIVGQNPSPAMRDSPATDSWAVQSVIDDGEYVIRVVGAAGRTIAWALNGTYTSFTPQGL